MDRLNRNPMAACGLALALAVKTRVVAQAVRKTPLEQAGTMVQNVSEVE